MPKERSQRRSTKIEKHTLSDTEGLRRLHTRGGVVQTVHLEGTRIGRNETMSRPAYHTEQGKSHPLRRIVRLTLVLPALGDLLGLSREQAATLSRQQEKFMNAYRIHQQRIEESDETIGALFTDGEPKPSTLRQHLTKEAMRRAHRRTDLYERTIEMRNVLTDGQREVLAHLTPHDLRCQMRRHLTRAEERVINEAACEVGAPNVLGSTRTREQSPTVTPGPVEGAHRTQSKDGNPAYW